MNGISNGTEEGIFDADIKAWLAQIEPSTGDLTVEQMRNRSVANNARARALLDPALTPPSEMDQVIDGPAEPIAIRVLSPAGDAAVGKPIVVYFHGGGWVIGDIETHLGHARRLCTEAGAVVVSVAYRLAPEHRFPAAFEDAVAATRWAAEHAHALGGDPDLLVVAGESAGAQLAASVALSRRDDGQPLAAQLLLYPVIDVAGRYEDETVNTQYRSRGTVHGTGLTVAEMVNFAQTYVDRHSSTDWRVSPIHADHLSALAPAVVHTASFDVLCSEGNRYADAMERAGVTVIKREHPSLNHSYFGLGGVSAAADAAAVQAASDLRVVLHLAEVPRR